MVLSNPKQLAAKHPSSKLKEILMKSIREAASQKLTWNLARDTYELRSATDLVAALKWQKGMSLFAGETADGRWTFKRTG
jgi:hypothetical protein